MKQRAAGSVGPSQSVRSAKRASAAVQVLQRMPAASARRAAKVTAEVEEGACDGILKLKKMVLQRRAA